MTDPAPVGPPPPAPPADAVIAGEVVGEPVALQVQPTFTAEQIKQDGRDRITRTIAQGAGGSGAVIVVRYLFLRYAPAQLPPDDVLLIAVGWAAGGWAWWANRHKLRGQARPL